MKRTIKLHIRSTQRPIGSGAIRLHTIPGSELSLRNIVKALRAR